MSRKSTASEKVENAHLFVYGTLMRGFKNAAFLGESVRASFLGESETRGVLFDAGDYPAFVPVAHGANPRLANMAGTVKGELYRLEEPAVVLETLDIIEGYNAMYPERSLFSRQLVQARVDGKWLAAWAYVYNQAIDRLRQIPSGDYRQYTRNGADGH